MVIKSNFLLPMRETSFIKMYSLNTFSGSDYLKGNIEMIKMGYERKSVPPQSREFLVKNSTYQKYP